MSLRNFIAIVASPRPRVGKTLLARMLTDYQLDNRRKVVAFDLNPEDPALTQFMPAHAAQADVSEINGQMALFDRLVADDGAHKIVDLGHASFKSFFQVAKDIDLAGEARRRAIAPVVLFIATPDATSVEAFATLRRELPNAAVVPVHNEVLGGAQHRDKFAALGPSSVLLHIPALAPGLRKIVDKRPFSFVEKTGAQAEIALDSHLELQRWQRRLFLEFREMELRVLLSDLQSSLQASP